MLRLRHLAALLLIPGLSYAAPPPTGDCAPLGRMTDFKMDGKTTRPYDSFEFERKNAAGDVESFYASGALCQAVYHLLPGKDTPSVLEIQTNYRGQLEAMGAEIVRSEGPYTYAHLVKNGTETWLRVYSAETSIETAVLQVAPPKFSMLPPGPADHPVIGHMPDFIAAKPVTRNFDNMTFDIEDPDGGKSVTAQGKTTQIYYSQKEGAPELGLPEIRFNYAEALRRKGAEILADSGPSVVARLLDKGQVIWVKIYTSGHSVELSVLEEKPFAPTIKPAELQDAIQKTGHVTLYVNFDFDQSTLRPDAAPVVAQVAGLLKTDPALRLRIEGHTDGMGGAEHNRTLSADRARAFMAAVVAQGVTADRLTTAGFGPDKPIASNDTSEGRAKNRRVELVRL